MKKKKRNNRVILAICSMFIAVMSIFAFIPKEKEIVKADGITYTSVRFDLVDFYFPIVLLSNSGNNSIDNSNRYIKFDMSFLYDNINFLHGFVFSAADFQLSDLSNPGSSGVSNYNQIYIDLTTYDRDYFRLNIPSFNNINYVLNIEFSGSKDSNKFNMSEPIGYTFTSEESSYDFMLAKNVLRFFDANDFYFQISFFTYKTFGGGIMENRTVYFSEAFNLDDRFNLGYRDGYNDGLNRGAQQGYIDGYGVGKNDGYNLGYNQALENRDIYTFDNLLSAVIDVPVKTFTSLFNFEILGVNLSGFFLGLLTCCIVITIVRLLI